MVSNRQEEEHRRLWALKESDPAAFAKLSTTTRLALGSWAQDKGLALPVAGQFYEDEDMEAVIGLRTSDPAAYARVNPLRKLKASHYEDEKNIHRFKTQKV